MELRVRGEGGEVRGGPDVMTLATCSPVGSVGCAKGVVDVNISQFGQRRPEGVDLLLRGLGLEPRAPEGNRGHNRA